MDRMDIDSLSLKERIGQMLYAYASRPLSKTRKLIEEGKLGAVFLTQSNMPNPQAALDITTELKANSKFPLFFVADAEASFGQQVVDGATVFPSPMAIGATRNTEYAYLCGKISALEARVLGVQAFGCPVLDVNTNPDNPVIGLRSYGESPELVADMGEAYIRGAQQQGVFTMGKHFPGHGDTSIDSHLGLPEVMRSREEVERIDLYPYKRAINAGVKGIMTAHVVFPALESQPLLPATLSKAIMTDLLRGELRFNGLLLSDGLGMKAVTDMCGMDDALVRCVNAGNDMILADDAEYALAVLVKAVKEGRIPIKRIDEAFRRIVRAKQDMGLLDESAQESQSWQEVVGIPEHQAIAKRVARECITLVKDEIKLLPLRISPEDRVCLIAEVYRSKTRDYFFDEFRNRHANTITLHITAEGSHSSLGELGVMQSSEDSGALEKQKVKALREIEESDLVVIGTWIGAYYEERHAGMNSAVGAAIEECIRRKKKFVFIAFGSPYVLKDYPEIPTYLCAYVYATNCYHSISSAVDILFGETSLVGKLPVTIIAGKYEFGHGITEV